MSSYADYFIRGDAEQVRSIGDQVLQGAGFTITWDERGTGHAHRGSLALTLLLGAFVGKNQTVKLDLTVFTGPEPGVTVIRLTSVSSGWIAGYFGARRNAKVFDQLVQDLATPFGQAGALLGLNRT